MTDPREPDRLIRAVLEDGPTVLPDRVLDSVLGEVHRTRQRAARGLWRIQPMSRTALAATAVIAVVLIGGLVLLGRGQSAPVVGGLATASPAPSLAPSPAPSNSPSPAPSVAASQVPAAVGPLAAGTTYRANGLSQPLSFVMPPGFPSTGVAVTGDPWADGNTLRVYSEGFYALTIHDDVTMAKDLCNDNKGQIDLPATPDAIESWLRSSSQTTVSKTTSLEVDGRTAHRWDVTFGPRCQQVPPPSGPGAEVWMGPQEKHRFYAIPTGTDTILAITWGDGVNDAAINDAADKLVQSMTFP